MVTGIVTTGLVPLGVGSDENFVLNAIKNGLFWDLTGGSARVELTDPAGNLTTLTATITNGVASATWTVTSVTGTWSREWFVTDSSGLRQRSRPITFEVAA